MRSFVSSSVSSKFATAEAWAIGSIRGRTNCGCPPSLKENNPAASRINRYKDKNRPTVNPLIREAAGLFSRSEEHTSELQSRFALVCRLLLEKKNRRRHH